MRPLINSTMKKSKIITKLVGRFPGLTDADALLSVKTIIDAMAGQLISGGRIELRGFGCFSVNAWSPRLCNNPKTGKSVPKPVKPVVLFKPGVVIRERMSNVSKHDEGKLHKRVR